MLTDAQPVPATKPELKLWPVLLRIAPKAKLNDLSDALFEQGFCLDMKLAPTELSASPPSDTERGGE